MARLLRELVQITTQAESTSEPPMLELQFGDIVTSTTLLANDDMQCLVIIAQLPRSGHSIRSRGCQPSWSSSLSPPLELELAWHADKGCYLALKQMAISEFTDEASVLDDILDTADRSRNWYISALRQQSKAA